MTIEEALERPLTRIAPPSLQPFPDTWHPYLELIRWDKVLYDLLERCPH